MFEQSFNKIKFSKFPNFQSYKTVTLFEVKHNGITIFPSRTMSIVQAKTNAEKTFCDNRKNK